MKYKLIILFLILFNCTAISDELTYNIYIGGVYGGPIPTKIRDGFGGKAMLAPTIGLSITKPINDWLELNARTVLSYKGVDFWGNYSKDTVVKTTIGSVTGYVPTEYTVNINGEIRILYFELPIFVGIKTSEMSTFFVGFQVGLPLTGGNPTEIRIRIGEGGFFEDSLYNTNDFSAFNKIDFAAIIGSKYQITENLGIGFTATRSFTPLYRRSPNRIDNEEIKLYNTHFSVLLFWKLF